MAEGPLFAMDEVSFAYGDREAVRDFSLMLAAGRFYGLVGPNGCGKTTLLDLLAGLRAPRTGLVCYRGRPVASWPKRELAREIALVPQDFAIHFGYTVAEVVMMGRHPHVPRFGRPGPEDEARAAEAMAAMGISSFQNRLVTDLSGGEKQRTVVARALAQQTPVLMLDEATSNLDIQHTLDIFNVVREAVREKGRTVVAVIHNLDLAAAYCDEIIFMKEGRLEAAGPAAEALTGDRIRAVFGVEARVSYDEFSGTSRISYRYGR